MQLAEKTRIRSMSTFTWYWSVCKKQAQEKCGSMRKSQPKVKIVPADNAPVPTVAAEKPETRPALEDFED